MSKSLQRAMARTIVRIRDVQRIGVEQDLAAAAEDVAHRDNLRRDAEEAMRSAAIRWGDHLKEGAFLPEIMAALAGQVTARESDLNAALTDLKRAELARDRQSERLVYSVHLRECAHRVSQDLETSATRQKEEQAQAIMEERTSFLWGRV